MAKTVIQGVFCCIILALFTSCTPKKDVILFDSESVAPGTQVSRKGTLLSLAGTPVAVGDILAGTRLVESKTQKTVDLAGYRGSVLLLSIVPSIDTKVCEMQTHFLGEEGDVLPDNVKRLTISRDTPFAQARFAREAKLEDVVFLSDYKEGEFGRSTGLLLEDSRLLARSVLLVDKQGIVRYIQVVPDTTHLPDMNRAFEEAMRLEKLP